MMESTDRRKAIRLCRRSVPIRVGLELSAGTNVAAKAASLIKASCCRAPRLSRGAATDRSHGRKAVVRVSFKKGAPEGRKIREKSDAFRATSWTAEAMNAGRLAS